MSSWTVDCFNVYAIGMQTSYRNSYYRNALKYINVSYKQMHWKPIYATYENNNASKNL